MSSQRTLLVTGSSGLIGSEVCLHFSKRGWKVHGVDNNQRAVFFGPAGDTEWNRKRLQTIIVLFEHHNLDIRDRAAVDALIAELKPDAIVHAAAQPSHDLAARIPFDDFDTNAVGTLNLLEATRRHVPECSFVYLSTNKVYGDGPNQIVLKEEPTRWTFAEPAYRDGIPETFPVDQCTHSLFGASKLAADVLVQEYGRYFKMNTCCLRGGCLTGPCHSGVQLHGFLSYLIKCSLERTPYTIFGYSGKQVRDNIHSEDVALFIEAFINNPRSAEVYNLGGGPQNTCSVLEALDMAAAVTGHKVDFDYSDQPRIGDHICYYSNLGKIRAHYPEWELTHPLESIVEEMALSWRQRLATTAG